jgi:hypothetical protein
MNSAGFDSQRSTNWLVCFSYVVDMTFKVLSLLVCMGGLHSDDILITISNTSSTIVL